MERNEEKDVGVGLGFDEKDERKTDRRRGPILSASSIPASLLVPLFKIEIQLRLIQIELKIYAALINHYPYALTAHAKSCFDEYQQKYHQSVRAFQRLQTPVSSDTKMISHPAEAAQKLLARCITMQQLLQKYLLDRLQPIVQSFRDEADDFLVVTVRNLHKNLVHQDNILPASVLISNTQTTREQCLVLDKKVTDLLKHWQTSIAYGQQQPQPWVSLQRRWQTEQPGAIVMMRRGQQIITAIRRRLNRSDELWRQLPLDSWLLTPLISTERDMDLNLLTALLKPEEILPALDRAYEFYLSIWLDLQNRVRALQSTFTQAEGLLVIRELRILLVYERWLAYLLPLANASEHQAWRRAVQVQRVLTWEKKAFFKQNLHQQPAQAIIARWETESQSHPTFAELLSVLRTEKARLIAQVAHRESHLLSGQSLWQRGMASVWISLTQQPDYLLGEQAFLSGAKQMDQLPRSIPALSEPLPEPLKKKCADLTGLTFLVIGLSVSQYAGYYAHAIGAINRVFSAQMTVWFRVGNTLDHGLTRRVIPLLERVMPKSFALSQTLRSDELSILEHDHSIQWCNGLVINGLLAWSQPWIYTFIGYSLATVVGEVAMRAVDRVARHRPMKAESLGFLKVAVHFAVYAPAYRLGIFCAAKWAPPKPAQMPLTEALKHFGLFELPATEQAIKKQYRQLSLRFHPDKCRGIDCANASTKMALVTEAKEVLLEQVRPAHFFS